jgi:ribosomal protein L37AE/L43A
MNQIKLKELVKHKIEVEGRSTLYNPLLQKPVALHPVGPGSYPAGFGGYAYIGPPPDFGGSYGAYEDDSGRRQVGVKSSRMFSIYDGSPIQLKSELTSEERESLLTQLEEVSEPYKCEHCRSELTISVTNPQESVYCPHCSTKMDGAAEKVKQCLSKVEEKKMAENKVQASEKAAVEPLNQTGKDLAKEAAKVEAPKEVNPHEKAPKAEPMDHAAAQKQASEVKPMEELAKAPTKVGSSVEERRAKLKASLAAHKAKRAAAKAQASVRPTAKVAAKLDEKTLKQLTRELRIMATLEPAKFAAVRKNPRISEICAKVETKLFDVATRAAARAELMALASTDVKAFEEMKKELDFAAPEILAEGDMLKPKEHEHKAKSAEELEKEEKEAHAGMEHKEGQEHKHEDKKADAAMPVEMSAEEKEKMEKAAKSSEELEKEEKEKAAKAAEADGCGPAMSMKTEFLASVSSLKGDKVEMSLYGEEGQDPFWNIIVDGEPVARIHLQDQKDAETIRAGFISNSYAENFGNAMSQVGVEKMLTLASARFFAHKVDETEATARIREKAKIEAQAQLEEKLATLRGDFLKAVNVAMVGASKNFYREEGRDALKGGLFNAMIQAGLTEQHAVWAIEAGFEDAPEYFEFVMDKAVEIMDMPTEARQAVEKTIMASGKIEIQTEEPKEDNLMDRLVKSSVSALAMGGIASGENKEGIRKELGFTPNRR